MAMRDDPSWMSLGNMRGNGVRHVIAWCGCGHRASLNADRWPDSRKVPGLLRNMRCTQCGARPRLVVPDWQCRRSN